MNPTRPNFELTETLVHRFATPPDPWHAFLRLAHLPHTVFLDSAAKDPHLGRYSYIAASPFEVLVGQGNSLSCRQREGTSLDAPYAEVLRTCDPPLRVAQERIALWSAERIPDLPPFQGGAAGYFGYNLGRQLQSIPTTRFDEFSVPEMVLGVYDWTLAFDHTESAAYLIAHGFPETSPSGRRTLAASRIRRVLELLGATNPRPAPLPSGNPIPIDALAPTSPVPAVEGVVSNFSRVDYLDAVEQGIEYIRAGDVFQVNLSQRLLYPIEDSPTDLYQRLRTRNPAPFAGYFHTGDAVIASSSPEQFLTLDDGVVVTRPIKGTRPRGYSAFDDPYQGAALFESEKDRTENVMIVDLLRNDLSKVAEPGSVEVPRLFEIERHPTVYHLVSEIRALLRPGQGAFDLLEAAFPGGSITGAPKIRAMEIIAELEPTDRGAYCGSMGWIGFDGAMSTNILIRTVTMAHGWLQFPVGGGVVAMSSPSAEYEETLNKAAGIVRALKK